MGAAILNVLEVNLKDPLLPKYVDRIQRITEKHRRNGADATDHLFETAADLIEMGSDPEMLLTKEFPAK